MAACLRQSRRKDDVKTISIIGAGLVGSLLAIYLARRDYAVDVFESRSDCRTAGSDNGRSINLAMSCRGITGLSGAGILPMVEKLMVPMRARAIHDEKGDVKYQAFGRHHDEYINAIQRTDLNKMLLDEAAKFPLIRWHFNTHLLHLDVSRKEAHFKRSDGSQFTNAYQRLIGADGASSQVRTSLQQQGLVSASRDFISHGYKEIAISSASSNHLAREHLHLWPRDSLLLLGNPNLDNSVTRAMRDPAYAILAEIYKSESEWLNIVLLFVIESSGHVFFGKVADQVDKTGEGSKLKYFSRSHLDAELAHAMFEVDDEHALYAAPLPAKIRQDAIQLVDRCYDDFHKMFDGLVAACNHRLEMAR